ncbi:hypothetical protein M3E11_005815 [Micrococcus luteus]|uniref:hypothetical protein n=1 Tax=Micrococcus luteus TaxID=1270 RepID=UPI002A73D0B1|nr:hypothetical protein [Micrococcus luteus]
MSSLDVSTFDPALLVQALGDAGWQVMGRSRTAIRLESPKPGPRVWVLVPVSREVPGATDMLREALEQVATTSSEGLHGLSALVDVRHLAGHRDSVRFRKETSAPRGLIQWSAGQELIEAARQTLVATAKAYMGTAPYFGNSHSGFAKRYLDACYMGQTGIGSYVVTALTPVGPERPSSLTGASTAHEMNGRAVTETMVTAIQAGIEAIDHYERTKSPSGFVHAVASGFSVEMARGLTGIAQSAEESTISIEWDPATTPLSGENKPVTFEFTAGDVPALEVASTTLVRDSTPPARQQVRGRVHLLTKADVAGPGVIGIDTGAGKFRVRLTPNDYTQAVQAHHDEQLVVVEGVPEREGKLTWLYNVRFLRVEAPSADSPLFPFR